MWKIFSGHAHLRNHRFRETFLGTEKPYDKAERALTVELRRNLKRRKVTLKMGKQRA